MSEQNVEVKVDTDLMGIIPQFFQNIRDELKDLGEAEENDFFLDASIFDHSLKGTGAAFGFDHLTELGRELELSGKGNDRDDVRRLLNEIAVYIDNVSYSAK